MQENVERHRDTGTVGASRAITLLHLSDTNFGQPHRFGNPDLPPFGNPFDTLLERLLKDLRNLEKLYKLRPDIVVLSGDLTASGKPSEFAKCLEFVESLIKALHLPRECVVLIPGNHDVNQDACQAYFAACKADEKEPQPPYSPKWRHYIPFFRNFYGHGLSGITFTEEQPWTFYEFEDLKCVLAGLNSTMKESHLDHYGWLGEDQLCWFADKLSEYKAQGWLRIAAIHHNIRRKPIVDDENLHDCDDLERLLGDSVNLFLHGHTCDGKTDWLTPDVPILSTGSAALGPTQRSAEIPNQYQIVQLRANGFTRWARAYAPDRKDWVGDTRASATGNAWRDTQTVPFDRVAATFQMATSEGPGDDSPPISSSGPLLGRLEAMGSLRELDANGKRIIVAPWISLSLHVLIKYILPVLSKLGYDKLHRTYISLTDPFLAAVEDVCLSREPGAKIKYLTSSDGRTYLQVLSSRGPMTSHRIVGASEQGLNEDLAQRVRDAHQHHQASDPGIITELVYGGDLASPEILKQYAKGGLQFMSFTEYRGEMDLRRSLEEQTRRLTNDAKYPPDRYVSQRINFIIGRTPEQSAEDALSTIRSWLRGPDGCFILVLGDIGTGKTFLLHELARQMVDESPGIIPILVSMSTLSRLTHRDLKDRDLKDRDGISIMESLLVQHLDQASTDRIKRDALRSMLEQGKLVLFFDGFDQLVLDSTYASAVEHFKILLRAAKGEAKIVATSRRQHFLSDGQVKTALHHEVDQLSSRRIVYLQPFSEEQTGIFLGNRPNGQQIQRWLQCIQEITGSTDLAENPRMLGFIAGLPEEALRNIQKEPGEIIVADLYQLLMEQWWACEAERVKRSDESEPLDLSPENRCLAVTRLALHLWSKEKPTVNLDKLSKEVGKVITSMDALQIDQDQATHKVGSGTLLTRDAHGKFGFIDQSVLEWFVANDTKQALEQQRPADALRQREMSALIVHFLCEIMTDEETIKKWAQTVLSKLPEPADEPARRNAQSLLRKLGEEDYVPFQLAGQNLRGKNFSGWKLTRANLDGADLTDARLVDCDLQHANFAHAVLKNADLSGSRFQGADMRGAVLDNAQLLGADLRDVQLDDSRLRRAKLVGARLSDDILEGLDSVGYAPSHPINPEPVLISSPSPCESVAWSPDGGVLASGHDDGSIRLWATANGQELRHLIGHGRVVRSVAFSPDGTRLASGADDGSVRLWGVANGQELQRLTGARLSFLSVTFSPGGTLLASGADDGSVRLWDVSNGQELKPLAKEGPAIYGVTFSPDGTILAASAENGSIRLWNIASGYVQWSLSSAGRLVSNVAFSRDGAILASGLNNGKVRLWDVARAQERSILLVSGGAISSVSFSPDGTTLAAGTNDGVHLWNVAHGQELQPVTGSRRTARNVAFSPDGTTLAWGVDDGSVQLWAVAKGQEPQCLAGYGRAVLSVAFSSNGTTLVSGADDGSARLWDVARGEEQHYLTGSGRSVLSMACSPDGRTLATGTDDGYLHLRMLTSSDELWNRKGHANPVRSIAFSPDSTVLASGADDGSIRLWAVADNREPQSLTGHRRSVWSVTFNPYATMLAAGADDGSIRLWALEKGQELQHLQSHVAVRSIAFHPQSTTLASGMDDGSVRLWDVARGIEQQRLTGHGRSVLSVAFSPDGTLLASGSDDGCVRLCRPADGQVLHCLLGHGGSVWSVAFSPKGAILASTGADKTVRLWETSTGECLGVLGHLPDGWVAYTPTGLYKLGGDVGNSFWHVIGLCRFEPGELDPYFMQPLRMQDDELLIPHRQEGY